MSYADVFRLHRHAATEIPLPGRHKDHEEAITSSGPSSRTVLVVTSLKPSGILTESSGEELKGRVERVILLFSGVMLGGIQCNALVLNAKFQAQA